MNRKVRRLLKSIGLGKSTPKDQEALLKEFSQCVAEAGQLQYKISVHQEELSELNLRIRKLNQAYTEILTEQRAAASSQQGGEAPSTSPSSPKQGE